MRDRLITLLLAVGALALFYMVMVPKPADPSRVPSQPVSIDIRGDGYQALWRWLEAQHIRTVSFRDRYDKLLAPGLPASGNLLITTLPHQAPVRGKELDELDGWIARGNTLLLVAAMDDTPRWSLGIGPDFLPVLSRMSGLAFAELRPPKPADGNAGSANASSSVTKSAQRALQSLLQPQRGSIVPRTGHPLLEGVASIATESAYPAARWVASGNRGALALELGDRTDHVAGITRPEPALWLQPRGEGQVIVLAYASPFTNAVVGRDDNARLFANIVAWSAGRNGAVLFDDAHQGLVNYYDPKAFFGDHRLHRTLLWMLLLWLLFVVGWQRMRAPASSWNPVDVTTFIKVTGGFLAARSGANAAALRLLGNFFNRIRQRLALPQDGEPVWDWLAAQATVPPAELARLRSLHARALARERIDLVQLQNCLTGITGKLL
jgi:hypothetical protein